LSCRLQVRVPGANFNAGGGYSFGQFENSARTSQASLVAGRRDVVCPSGAGSSPVGGGIAPPRRAGFPGRCEHRPTGLPATTSGGRVWTFLYRLPDCSAQRGAARVGNSRRSARGRNCPAPCSFPHPLPSPTCGCYLRARAPSLLALASDLSLSPRSFENKYWRTYPPLKYSARRA
jgi:hypothetical protein